MFFNWIFYRHFAPTAHFKNFIFRFSALVGVVTIGVRKIENKALGRAIPFRQPAE